MTTDPILHLTIATRNHTELVRDGHRERLAGAAHAWYLPLTASLNPARAALGTVLIRLGHVVQGAAIPTPTQRAA